MKSHLRPLVSFVRVPPIANLLPEEMPVYKQLKIGFTIYVHLKVPHDTPPLRGFQLHVSRVLELRVSRPSNLVFRKPGFRPLLGPISPGWTPGLGPFFLDFFIQTLLYKCRETPATASYGTPGTIRWLISGPRLPSSTPATRAQAPRYLPDVENRLPGTPGT